MLVAAGHPAPRTNGSGVDDYFAGTTGRQASPTVPVYPPPAPSHVPPAWAAPPTGAPPYQGVPQQGWGAPYAPPPPSSGLHPALLAVIVVFATIVVMGVLAAVAIPVFLHERDLARKTVVAAPEQVLGMPRLNDAISAAAMARMEGLPGPGDHVAGVYGTGDVRIVVGAARYHLSSDDQDGYLDAAASEATSQGVSLEDVEPGRLGGTMRCGTASQAPMTICVFSDGGSYGVVVVTGPADDPGGTARGAREAFVRRT